MSLFSKAQTEAELKENAEQLFQKEQYVEATSLFLRLLSLQPRNYDYNYKYGTCLLFNSNKKDESLRYLTYAVQDALIDPAAFFFLGRAYHLNYQFNNAIKEYQNYQQKAGTKGNHYQEAERNKEMCNNGKKLLSTITEIIVTKKTEIKSSDFFRIYNLSNIGGSIVVAADFQTKNDKKMNHVPIVHFPVGTDKIFYGSYGDGNQMDIFMVRRLPDGKFSLPLKVEGGVNSPFDEDYPYLHPTDGYLYFSSKGHNSMGGYDVFRAKYLEESNSFGPAENIDFAISSPDDDIMYMVDKDDKNAYFTSARQSQDGKLYVYEVLVDRVPIQLAIVKGKFESGINPENKKMSVEVIDLLTDKNIGKFNTTKDGTYLITFPKGGKYEYRITVEGSNEKFTAQVEIPYLKEFKPLKQKMLHEAVADKEKIRVLNLFNEDVEDAQAIIAQVLKQRSDLNVNINEFDLNELENAQKTKQILADLGMSELSVFEVGQLLEQKSKELATENTTTKSDNSASNALVLSTVAELNKLDKEVKELVKEANQSESDVVQHSLLKQAQALTDDRILKLKEMNEVQQLQAKISGNGIPEATKKDFSAKATSIQQLIANGNEADALKMIAANKEVLKQVLQANEKTSATSELIVKQEALDKQLNSLIQSENSFTNDIEALEAEIRTLEEQKGNVKDKFKEEIQQKIDIKQAQLKEFKDQREVILKKEKSLSDERKMIVNELEAINTLQNYSGPKVTEAQATEAKKSLNNENAKSIDQYIDTQIAELIKNNPDLENSNGNLSETAKIIAEYNSKAEKVISNNANSKEKNAGELIALNNSTIEVLQERIAAINNLLETDRFNEQLRKEKGNNEKFIAKLQKENVDLENTGAANEITDYTPESLANELSPNYLNEKEAIAKNTQLSPQERNNQLNSADQNYLTSLEKELTSVQNELKQHATDKNLIAKEKALIASKENVNQAIEDRKATKVVEKEFTTETLQAEIAPNYSHQKEGITSDQSLSPKEKLEQLNKADANYISTLQKELSNVSEQLQSNSNSKSLQSKKNVIENELSVVQDQLDERSNELAQLESSDKTVEINETSLLTDIDASYSDKYEAIKSNSNLSEKELLEQLQGLDQQLLVDIQKTMDFQQHKLLANPNDKEAQDILKVAEKIFNIKESDVEKREKDLQKLNENTVDSLPKTDEELTVGITERIHSTIEDERTSIANSSNSEADKHKQLLLAENNYLKALQKDEKSQKKLLLKNQDDQNLKNEVALLQIMIDAQEKHIAEISTPNSVETHQDVVAQLDPSYQKEIASLEKSTANDKYLKLLARENEHQQKIENEISNVQSAANSSEQAAKLNTLTEAYQRSIVRVNELQSKQNELATTTNTLNETQINETEFVSNLHDKLLDQHPDLLNESPSDLKGLQVQDERLAMYEKELLALKSQKEKDKSLKQNAVLQQEIKILGNEIEVVKQKRREVSVSIGELEQNLISDASSDEKLQNLVQRDQSLKEQLSAENLTVTEKQAIEKQRAEIAQEKAIIENPMLVSKVEQNSTEINQLTNSNEDAVAANMKLIAEQKKVNELVNQATKTKSETSKNYLLKEAERVQSDAISNYIDHVVEEKVLTVEKENSITSLQSKEELESRQRQFTIDIGTITQQINTLQTQKEVAKSKDKAGFDTQISVLEKRKVALESQLALTEQKLASFTTTKPIIAKNALSKEISYQEEFEIASTENYANYANTANEIARLESSKRSLEHQLEKEKITINQLMEKEVTNSTDYSYDIEESAKKIRQFSVEIGAIETQLANKKKTLEQLAPSNKEEEMKFNNLVLRGINPIKKVALAAALIPLPASGIEINSSATSATNNVPIAVGVTAPSGLVYRVQVGAFSKPIPEDLFKEFTPVSGEIIANTNITRYMAGYFNNSEKVVNARDQIKTLGYSDAFVVAYCDGERISFSEARDLERSGKCVAKGENELMLEVAQNTAQKLGLSDTTQHKVSNTAYNQAPGAAKADAIEEIKGLFFTVQIAVYNKPVPPAQLLNIEPLITIRLPNGQIRYSTGVYQDYNSALTKQNFVRSKGIIDAFVTAYYNGERIGWQEGVALLEKEGKNILTDSKNGVAKLTTKVEDRVVQNSKQVEVFTPEVEIGSEVVPNYGIQIISKNSYSEYPRDVLNRYNAKGSFYFDENDGKVKSVIYDSEYRLPRINGFKNDVDTVYITKDMQAQMQSNQLIVKLSTDELPGDFADWMLKLNQRREIKQSENGLEIRIFDLSKEALEKVTAELTVFGLETEVQQRADTGEGK